MGSGQDLNSNSNDFKQIVTALDADPHYTFVYEYFARTSCIVGLTGATAATTVPVYGKNTGFCNTTALNLGVSADVTKWFNASLDYWMLKALRRSLLLTQSAVWNPYLLNNSQKSGDFQALLCSGILLRVSNYTVFYNSFFSLTSL
jgi:hypothetical protein